MARPLRIEYPGAVYHVMNRGLARQPVFRDPHDFETFLQVLGETHAYSLYTCIQMGTLLALIPSFQIELFGGCSLNWQRYIKEKMGRILCPLALGNWTRLVVPYSLSYINRLKQPTAPSSCRATSIINGLVGK